MIAFLVLLDIGLGSYSSTLSDSITGIGSVDFGGGGIVVQKITIY